MNRLGNILFAILVAFWLAGQFVFVVYEFDKVVLLKFGKLVQSDIAPGLESIFIINWVVAFVMHY